MTAFNLRLVDAVFPTSLRGLRLPNRRKLAGEYVFGVSQAESVKNRADASKPLTVQGAPTYTATSANVRSSTNTGFGFLTGMIPNDDATMILVRKGGSGAQAIFAGIAPAIGFLDFGANTFGANGEGNPYTAASRPIFSNAVVAFEALVMSKANVERNIGGFGKLYTYSAGVQQVSTSVNPSVTGRIGGVQIAIGTNQLTDSIDTNSFDVYFFALYQRPLTAAEIDEAFQSLKADYATRGVTIT